MNGAGIGMANIAKILLIILMALPPGKREFAGMLDMPAQSTKLERPIEEKRNQIVLEIIWDLELGEVNNIRTLGYDIKMLGANMKKEIIKYDC